MTQIGPRSGSLLSRALAAASGPASSVVWNGVANLLADAMSRNVGVAGAIANIDPRVAGPVVAIATLFGLIRYGRERLDRARLGAFHTELERLAKAARTNHRLLADIADGTVPLNIEVDAMVRADIAGAVAEMMSRSGSGLRQALRSEFATALRDHAALNALVHFAQDYSDHIETVDILLWTIERRTQDILQRLDHQDPPLAPHNLPAPPPDFEGRTAELEGLRRLIASTPDALSIVGLRGMGGVGKTALALQLAHDLAGDYPDAAVFLDLRAMTDPLDSTHAQARIIRAVANKPELYIPNDPDERAELYRSALGRKRAVIVLDNARGAAQTLPLLPPAGCLLIVTSREKFELPGMHARDLDVLREDEAVALLKSVAPRLGRAEFQGAARDLAAICGRLPLALRIAAGALQGSPNISPQECIDRLREAGLPGVGASLALSESTLPEDDRGRWHSLAFFPGDFDALGAAAVWAVRDQKAASVTLAALWRASVVEFDEPSGRYRLHDLVRDYARTHIPPGVPLAFAKHYLAVASDAEASYRKGHDGVLSGLALFDREWPNIRSAIEWTQNQADYDLDASGLCIKFPDAAPLCLNLRLHPTEQQSWLKVALETARRHQDRDAVVRHLGAMGVAARSMGDVPGAIRLHEEQLALAKEIGDRREEMRALGNLGVAFHIDGNSQRAIELHQRQLDIARIVGDRRAEMVALGCLGNVYAHRGDTARATEHYDQILPIVREFGDRRAEANTLGNLGFAHAASKGTRQALELYDQALAIVQEIGDRRGVWILLGNIGLVHVDTGTPARAIPLFERQVSAARDVGDRRGEGYGLGNLGRAYEAIGQTGQAITYYERHLSIATEIGDRAGVAYTSWHLGLTHARLGNTQRAAELMQVRVAHERRIQHVDAEEHAAQVERLRATARER